MSDGPTRRHALQLMGVALAGMLTQSGCRTACEPSQVTELKALADFLKPPIDGGASRKTLENGKLLYDIARLDEKNLYTTGRAVRLTDNYYLTAHHVVDSGTDKLYLLPQQRRGYLLDGRSTFELVAFDEQADIALLKSVSAVKTENLSAISLCHLATRIPELGEVSLQFTRLSLGKPPLTDYKFTVLGEGLYQETGEERLCDILLPSGSWLLEERGTILELKPERLALLYPKESLLTEASKLDSGKLCLSSVLSYNGESGAPMFCELPDGSLVVAGIVSQGLSKSKYATTPGHPLGYEKMQIVTTAFVHRDPIAKLIESYIEKF